MSSPRALALIMRLYPASFRQAFGDEMLEVFALRCQEVRQQQGRGGMLVLWARTLPGVMRAAFLERLESRRSAATGAAAGEQLIRPGSDGSTPGNSSSRLPRRDRNPMGPMLQDFRYGLRSLARSPGFTAIAVITLGIGIGINTSVFSLVNALLFRPLPQVQEPSTLAVLFSADGGRMGVTSYMDYLDFRERTRTLDGFAAYKALSMDLSTEERTERIEGMIVTAEYFSVLGVRPVLGRFFTPEDDDEVDAETVAVLGHDFWQTAFAGDRGVVGRTVRLNGRSFNVIGVAPEGFRGTILESRPAVFAPMMMQPHFMPSSGNLLGRRGWGGILTVGRLAEGVTLEQARTDFAGIADWLRAEYPDFAADREYLLMPLDQATIMPSNRVTVVQLGRLLLGVVGVVLLVACVNIANLSLARSLRRRREMAVRRALGAGSGRLARQLLIESITLASFGGVVGVALAFLSGGVLRSLPLPFDLDVGVDIRILAFATGMSVLTGVLFGIAPALSASRFDLAAHMQGSATNADRSGRQRLTSALVVAQVALSIVLLVGAGLFARTLINLGSTELGFDVDNIVIAAVDPALQGYQGAEVTSFYGRLIERVEASPGVTSVSLVSALPGGGSDVWGYQIEGFESPERLSTAFLVAGPRYFETVGTPILAGRDFAVADNERAEPVLIVNESAATELSTLTGREVLGMGLSFAGPDGPFRRIVGVAVDAKTSSVRADPIPMVYTPQAQTPGWSRMTLLVRASSTELASTLGAVRLAFRETDPNVPAIGVMTLTSYLDSTLGNERLSAALLGFSAILAVVLAGVGLYGVLSYSVGQRRGELGIRMALGAQTGDVRRMVVRHGMVLALLGAALGLAGAAAAGSLLSGLLFGVSSFDVTTYVGVIAILAVVACTASYIPARRATRVDPLTALRTD